MSQAERSRANHLHRRCGPSVRLGLALAVVTLIGHSLFREPAVVAQTTSQQAQAAKHRKKPAASHTSLAAAPATLQPAPVLPQAPPAPNWPANDRPSEAKVTWDSRGLSIVAANSSLSQILKDVSTQTGATMQGFNHDERIFGAYGPGPARDVINQLLDGSGYNVLMIGDQGEGTPRQILLTPRSGGVSQPSGTNSQNPSTEDDSAVEQEAQQPEPPPPPAPPAQTEPVPGVPMRTQQEIIEQMRQRQQQMQQQQQQQPQNPQ